MTHLRINLKTMSVNLRAKDDKQSKRNQHIFTFLNSRVLQFKNEARTFLSSSTQHSPNCRPLCLVLYKTQVYVDQQRVTAGQWLSNRRSRPTVSYSNQYICSKGQKQPSNNTGSFKTEIMQQTMARALQHAIKLPAPSFHVTGVVGVGRVKTP